MGQSDLVETWIAHTGVFRQPDLQQEPRQRLSSGPHGRVGRLQVQHQVV